MCRAERRGVLFKQRAAEVRRELRDYRPGRRPFDAVSSVCPVRLHETETL